MLDSVFVQPSVVNRLRRTPVGVYLAQNQHSCHQPPARTSRSIREPLTLSPLQPDSGRRYAD
jgi:hypothetical protein